MPSWRAGPTRSTTSGSAVSCAIARTSLRSGWPARRLAVAFGTVPIAAAGASLLAEAGGGLYWLLAGIILAILGAVLNAWVLLVEILR